MLAAVVVASVGGAAGASAQPTSRDAGFFLATVVRQLAANDYADAWQTLHPVDQALVPRNAYVACESASPIPGRLVSVRILSSRRELVALTLSGPIVSSVLVRLALLIADPAAPPGVRVRVLAHAILVHRRWRWMLSPARLAADRSCAASVATTSLP